MNLKSLKLKIVVFFSIVIAINCDGSSGRYSIPDDVAIVRTESGCSVYMAKLTPHLLSNNYYWSGNCVDGFPDGWGTLALRYNSKKIMEYEGTFSNRGVFFKGKISFENGDIRKGSFKYDKAHGYIEYFFVDGTISKGHFNNGIGRVKYYYRDELYQECLEGAETITDCTNYFIMNVSNCILGDDRKLYGIQFSNKYIDVKNVTVKVYFSYSKSSAISSEINSVIDAKDILIKSDKIDLEANEEYTLVFGNEYQNSLTFIIREAYNEYEEEIDSSLLYSIAAAISDEVIDNFDDFYSLALKRLGEKNLIYAGKPLDVRRLERPHKIYIIFSAENYKSEIFYFDELYSYKWR